MFQVTLTLSYFLCHPEVLDKVGLEISKHNTAHFFEKKERNTNHTKTCICFLMTHLKAQGECEEVTDTN